MIKISIKGLGIAEKAIKERGARAIFALIRATRQAGIAVQSLAKIKAPVFRGTLRASILTTVKEEQGQIIGLVGSGQPYANAIEFGGPPKIPPIEDLKIWARRKLGNERLAYPIQKTIGRFGIRKQPYLRPAAKDGASRVEMIFKARMREAVEGGL